MKFVRIKKCLAGLMSHKTLERTERATDCILEEAAFLNTLSLSLLVLSFFLSLSLSPDTPGWLLAFIRRFRSLKAQVLFRPSRLEKRGGRLRRSICSSVGQSKKTLE